MKTGPGLQVSGGFGVEVKMSESRKNMLDFEDSWLDFRAEESCLS